MLFPISLLLCIIIFNWIKLSSEEDCAFSKRWPFYQLEFDEIQMNVEVLKNWANFKIYESRNCAKIKYRKKRKKWDCSTK